MTLQTFCQLVIMAAIIGGVFHGLYQDFNGRKAREPYGFGGAVITLIVSALMLLVNWKAGAFSTLFR